MKVTILTCFESNEERASYIFDACTEAGHNVKVVTTDFSHIRKAKRDKIPTDFISINTKPYVKNLSIRRMYSHSCFARDAFKYIENNPADILWVIAPANSLIKEAKKYKKNNPDTRIIIDIIDMWPESLPLSFNKHAFPFSLWRDVRRKNIDCADVLVSECNFYKRILKEEYKKEIETLYLARDEKIVKNNININNDKLSLCYIGSINNIVDTDKICRVIGSINKPVSMHVIGEGENTEYFIKSLERVCDVTYYGAIRDEDKKSDIFNKCHAGINIYKDGLYIGLTTKCIDYFKNGLPIINNIKGDTWEMVEEKKIGFNVDDNTVLDADEVINARCNNENVYELYENNFTKEVFTNKCLSIIKEAIR